MIGTMTQKAAVKSIAGGGKSVVKDPPKNVKDRAALAEYTNKLYRQSLRKDIGSVSIDLFTILVEYTSAFITHERYPGPFT